MCMTKAKQLETFEVSVCESTEIYRGILNTARSFRLGLCTNIYDMNSSFLRWEKVKNWIYKNRSNKITIVVWPQNVSLLNFCPFVCWTILINQIISLILKIFIWIWTWSRVYFEGSIYFWKVKIEPKFSLTPRDYILNQSLSLDQWNVSWIQSKIPWNILL